MRTVPLLFILCCIFLSIASESIAQTYYSRGSGNWATASTWSTVSCGGTAASSAPTTGANVVICNGHTITYNPSSAVTIANLTIQSTGTLSMPQNRNLIINSFVLDGTVSGNGDGDIRMGTAAGSTLSGVGSYATGSNKANLRLVNNVTVVAGSDIKFSSDGRLNMAGKTLTNNGKVTIGANSQISGGGVFVNNASTSHFIYARNANFPTGTTLTSTATGNIVEFSGNGGQTRQLDAQGSYYHLIIGGTSTKRFRTASITIAGNLTINNNATLDANTGTRNINIAGNWVNNLGGTFNEQASTVTFNGSSNNQTLAPPTGGETFVNLIINNTFLNGSVTASGNVSITSGSSLTMTSGTFDMATFTLGESGGAANLTASGGNLRFGKTSGTLPEFTGTYNVTGGTITFSGAGNQTIRSLNATPATYYHISLGGSGTKTLAGNVSVAGNWTNSGVSLAGNFVVTFSGSGLQTISKSGGETFYGLTVNTTGPLTLSNANTTDVTVTNSMTMTSGNVNLNTRTLTLGNSGTGASLSRANGICYGGVFRRYFPAVAITSTSGSFYGLFPIGTSLNYRPVTLNSSTNPTTAGYVSATHTDATTANDVNYNDNQGVAIQRVTVMESALSTSAVDGVYTIAVSFTTLSSIGALTDLRLETVAGSPPGVGNHTPTTGSVASPTASRTNVSASQLNNRFVIGTINRSATSLVSSYYSRKTGNWTDNSADATWSTTDGGPSCNCFPTTSSMVYIKAGHVVSVNAASITDFVTVRTGGTLNGTANFTVNYDLTTEGTGRITPTAGAWTIARDLNIQGTSTSSVGAGLTVGLDLQIDAANSLTLGGNSNVAGNLIVDGTLNLGTTTMTLGGLNTTISGSGGAAAINGTGKVTINRNKTVAATTNLTVQPAIELLANTTVSNAGTITTSGNVTGTDNTSIWTNASNSAFTTSGTFLSTGVLNAHAVPNTFTYNAAGAQNIKTPSSSYNNLVIATSGTKTMQNDFAVANLLTIKDAAILNAGTNSLSGAGGLTMTGTSGLTISRTTSTTYPELTGAYLLTGGTVTLSPASGSPVVRGVDYYNLTLAGAVKYDFSLAPSVVNNFVYSSTNTGNGSPLNTDFTVGSYTQTAGNFNTNGTIILEITLPGGWTLNGGTFSPDNNTTVLFSGSADQTIGGSAVSTFTKLEISNSGPVGVTLNQDVNVSGDLTFTAGNIISTSANTLTMQSGSGVVDISDDSFVDGPVIKIGSSNFTFPVGKDGVYRPIGVEPNGNNTFQAEYFHADPTAAGYNVATKETALTRVNSGEYWILNRTAGSGAKVILSWDDYSGTVDDRPALRVARWDNTKWVDHGNGGTSGSVSPGTGTISTTGNVTSFSPFTLASSNGNNPLPVELVSFTGTLKADTVWLNWVTASELNNESFTIERSKNGKDFDAIGSTPGAGTSQLTKTYQYADARPLAGISYYRLKQTDFDLKYSYSNVVAIDNRGASETIRVDVFPNPSESQDVGVFVSGLVPNEALAVKIINQGGQAIIESSVNADSNGMLVYTLDTQHLGPGIYIFKTQGVKGPIIEKIIHTR